MARFQDLPLKGNSNLDADGIGIILESARSAAAMAGSLTSTDFSIRCQVR
jgi:hypothetical protein